jgi:hypothetical protein
MFFHVIDNTWYGDLMCLWALTWWAITTTGERCLSSSIITGSNLQQRDSSIVLILSDQQLKNKMNSEMLTTQWNYISALTVSTCRQTQQHSLPLNDIKVRFSSWVSISQFVLLPSPVIREPSWAKNIIKTVKEKQISLGSFRHSPALMATYEPVCNVDRCWECWEHCLQIYLLETLPGRG